MNETLANLSTDIGDRADRYLADTHEVVNQPSALEDYNLYKSDVALREAVAREGGQWAQASLERLGERLGRADFLALGELANRYPPELDTHDRFGRRVDLVRFHPAYHTLMESAITERIHASPWTEARARGACGPGGQIPDAVSGRGRARLPDHDDLCRGAGLAPATGSRRPAGSR